MADFGRNKRMREEFNENIVVGVINPAVSDAVKIVKALLRMSP